MNYIAQERKSTLPSVLQDGTIFGTCEVFRPSTKEEIDATRHVSQHVAYGVLIRKKGKQYALWYDKKTDEFAFCEHPKASYGD